MNASLTPADASPSESATSRAVLSLDAFVINGISFGVFDPTAAARAGFVALAAGHLRRDAKRAQEGADAAGQARQGALWIEACERLIGAVFGLCDHERLSPEQVRAAVAGVLDAHRECVGWVEQLDPARRTGATRPARSAELVESFMSDLLGRFAQERAARSG